MFATLNSVGAAHKGCLALVRLGAILCLLLNAMQLPGLVRATEDVANVSPCELESIINQLVNPNAQYQLHATALRNQLKNILRERQLAVGEEQSLSGDYDYPEEDKRSLASLASHGYLRTAPPKRGLGILAKNGQLPATSEPGDDVDSFADPRYEKRYLGSLARSGALMSYGKRNIGTLARDFQLPQNGKRNVATLARLGLLSPKRNVAAVARYNSNRMSDATASSSTAAAAEKRNLGALKGSPVHGGQLQQKRAAEEAALLLPGDLDYVEMAPGQWLYPSYGDLGDWEVLREQQKRFLDTSKDPELFGILNAPRSLHETAPYYDDGADGDDDDDGDGDDLGEPAWGERVPHPQKRHIGSIARSGFLPSYSAFRGTFGSGGGGLRGGFSRSGRDARQFGEFYPQRERLRQPIAAACKRCFLPNRPTVVWGGVRRLPSLVEAQSMGIMSNALPAYERRPPLAAVSTSWGTPPRITALHRRSFRRPNAIESYQY